MLTAWKLDSGATHRKQWEAINKIDRDKLLPTDDADVVQGPSIASSDQLRVSAAAARNMIG